MTTQPRKPSPLAKSSTTPPPGSAWTPTEEDLTEAQAAHILNVGPMQEAANSGAIVAVSTAPDSGSQLVWTPTEDPDSVYDEFVLRVPKIMTEHARSIFQYVLPDVMKLFAEKSNRYGEPDGDDLGIAGTYADMHRKWKRLRKHMWEGESWPEGGEPFEEVLMDMVGHCLKTIEWNRAK